MAVKCPKCQSENPDASRFCAECGTSLGPVERISVPYTRTIISPKKELSAGDIFAERYRIVEKLGEGGMGVVCKAEDTRLKRIVALKLLSPVLTQDEEARERFVHEAQAASGLDHTNICTIHEIDESEDGQMFIAMAYYDGETLKQKIEQGPLELEEALNITVQIAQGLSKAQGEGIVHRDIKPANVMVASDGVVKILDFGLAKLASSTRITKTGTTMGTTAYMSPEQASGETVDERADIWSLGVVLYEMLTGQRPFKGEHEQSVIYSILNKEPEKITDLQAGIPKELEQIVSKALAKEPNKRYQHADELLDDLQEVYKALDMKPAWRISVWSRLRRRKWFASPFLWISIIAVLGIVIGLLIFYPAKAIPFQERDWVLITDFENLTGDEVFNKSLNTALSVSIGQSSYINVFPRRRIDASLRRMKKEDVEYIEESVGREIAEREGIKVILVPTISQVGETYVFTCVIEDPSTGKSYKSEIVHSQGKNEVLNALDELTEKIRSDLGETLSAISEQSKPLMSVTTSSLEALRQYSLAIENHRKANFNDAKIYYENALRIDPDFTAAKASLGNLNFERFDREKGKELLEEAVKDVADLTDREKYGILSFYAKAVKNSLQESLEYLKALLALYPDDSAAHNNLGLYYAQMGRLEDAVAEYKEAIRVDPYLMLTYNNLVNLYIRQMGDLDSALEWCERQLSYDDRHIWAHNNMGWAYLGKDDYDLAEVAFKKALEIDPNFVMSLFSLGHTHRLQGRYAEAVPYLQKILEINPEEPYAAYQLGVIYQLIGDDNSARIYFEKWHRQADKWVKENPRDAYSYISLALAYSLLGEKERGWTIGQKAMELDPNNHFGSAQLLSVQGRIQEAIDQLELLVEKGYRNYIWIKIHPDFQPLYQEPRFKDLINKGLKKSDKQ